MWFLEGLEQEEECTMVIGKKELRCPSFKMLEHFYSDNNNCSSVLRVNLCQALS